MLIFLVVSGASDIKVNERALLLVGQPALGSLCLQQRLEQDQL